MKRINIFVLLCVFIFTICTSVAAADDDPQEDGIDEAINAAYEAYARVCVASSDSEIAGVAPIVNPFFFEDGEEHENVTMEIKIDDYWLKSVTGQGTFDEPYILKLKARNVQQHPKYEDWNTEAGYYVGVTLARDDDDTEGTTYAYMANTYNMAPHSTYPATAITEPPEMIIVENKFLIIVIYFL